MPTRTLTVIASGEPATLTNGLYPTFRNLTIVNTSQNFAQIQLDDENGLIPLNALTIAVFSKEELAFGYSKLSIIAPIGSAFVVFYS